MEIWVPTLIAKVRGIALHLLMVFSAEVETTDRVVASLIGVLRHQATKHEA
jgi:hypothetical protein